MEFHVFLVKVNYENTDTNYVDYISRYYDDNALFMVFVENILCEVYYEKYFAFYKLRKLSSLMSNVRFFKMLLKFLKFNNFKKKIQIKLS